MGGNLPHYFLHPSPLQELGPPFDAGPKKLTELRRLADKVGSSTSARGSEVLKITVNSMENAWNDHIARIGEYNTTWNAAHTVQHTSWNNLVARIGNKTQLCTIMLLELVTKTQHETIMLLD